MREMWRWGKGGGVIILRRRGRYFYINPCFRLHCTEGYVYKDKRQTASLGRVEYIDIYVFIFVVFSS